MATEAITSTTANQVTASGSVKAVLPTLTVMSAMEAELVAVWLAMKKIVHFSHTMTEMTEMGFKDNFKVVQLFIDNTSTLFVIENRTYDARTKHVAMRLFRICQPVKEGKISIHYVPTEDQPKNLNNQRHRKLLNKS